MGSACSWEGTERVDTLRHGLWWLWPRPRHGRRREILGQVVGLAREGGGARGEGESGRGLTAVLLVLLARQGRHGVRRIDGGELRWPATERRW